MKPLTAPDELARLQQESIASAIRLAQLTVEASEKLLGVQLDAARQAIEAGSRTAQALAQVSTPEQAMALRVTLAEQAVEQALEYSESVYSVAADLQDQFGRMIELRVDTHAADLQAAMQKMLGTAPPGAEAATAAVRQALVIGQSAFEGMTRTTRQLSDMARNGVKETNRVASEVAKSAVKGRTPRSDP